MKKTLYIILVATGISSCFFDDDASSETVVLTEDIIYTSSNKVRLIGRLYSKSNEITQHGFYLSKDENFLEPVVQYLGSMKNPGLFLSEFDSLDQETTYYYKAFVESNSEVYFSQANAFVTFKANVNTIEPFYGNPGETVYIAGNNITDQVEIYFGNQKAEISKRIFDIGIEVTIPKAANAYKVPVIVHMDGKSVEVDSFEYVTGKWTLLSQTDFGPFYDFVEFKDDESYTIGLGNKNQFSDINADFYTFDLKSYTWSEQTINGDAVIPTSGSFYSTLGYFGSGSNSIESTPGEGGEKIYNPLPTLYQYKNGQVTDLSHTMTFTSQDGAGFSIDNILYVAGGLSSTKTLRAFDGTSWTELAKLPFDFNERYPHVTVNHQEVFLNSKNEVWVLDPTTTTVVKAGNFPRTVTPGSILYHNDEIHVGLFSNNTLFFRLELTEQDGVYSFQTTPKNNFPGDYRKITVGSFAHEGKLYFLRAPNPFTKTAPVGMEFWQFEPYEFE